MTIKAKDFQKAASLFKEFLQKLDEDTECAELRDSLNLTLLHMQKYYHHLRQKTHHQVAEKHSPHNMNLNASARGLSPMTPFRDAPDKFQWRWFNVDSPRITGSLPLEGDSAKTLPLIIQATKEGDVDLINDLVKKDCDSVHEVDSLGRSAVTYAIQYNQRDALEALLNNQADVNGVANDGSTAVHRACYSGNHNSLALFIQHNASVSEHDTQGRAPIHWACTADSTECLKLLLAQNVDVTVRDKDGLTPSMWACRLDHIDHFQLLCESQDIDDGMEQDNMGKTWMHWSVRRTEPLECLRTLLTEETALIKDEEGRTVFLSAAEQGSVAACKTIIEIVGVNCIHDTDSQERTSLHLAILGGHGELVNYLLDNGADMMQKDKYNASPMDYASGRQLHYCQLILSAHKRQMYKKRKNATSTPDGDSPSPSNSTQHEEYQESTVSKPVTPPHPPPKKAPSNRKPPHAHPAVNNASSRQNSAPSSRNADLSEDNRHVVSAGFTRTTPDRMIPAQNKGPLIRLESVDGTATDPEALHNENQMEQNGHNISGHSPELLTPSPLDDNSLGGMDVSDIDEEGQPVNHQSQPHPPARQSQKITPPPPSLSPPEYTEEPNLNQKPLLLPRKEKNLFDQDVKRPTIGLLQPLGPMSCDQGAKSPKKKKKKERKAKADPAASMPPVKSYVAPMQPPPMRHNMGPPGDNLHMKPPGMYDHGRSPERDTWEDERPSAPIPPYSPRDPPSRGQFSPGSPVGSQGNGSHHGLQRMESEEDLGTIDDYSKMGQQRGGNQYHGPNYHGNQPRENVKSLVDMGNRQGPGMKNHPSSGITSLQRAKAPMSGGPHLLGMAAPMGHQGEPHPRLLPNTPQGQGQKLMYGQTNGPHPPGGRGQSRPI